MIYCDTSFLLALYVETDRVHAQAVAAAARFREPIPFTLLAELELENGIRRALAAGLLDRKGHDAIFRQITDDQAEGILARHPLPQGDHYAKARELSRKFTPDLSSRSLDILHVAAALLLEADALASFDDKQRLLASRAGLKSIPVALPKRKP